MKIMLSTAFAAAIMLAAPALAANIVSVDFGRTPPLTNQASLTSFAPTGLSVSVSARFFSGPVANLTNLSNLRTTANSDGTGATALLNINADGIGVPGGGSPSQVDTNLANRREALLIESGTALGLRSFRLAQVDSNDTVRILGVDEATGNLQTLGFSNIIINGGTGFTWTSAGGGRGTMTFNPQLLPYRRFVVTSFADGQNGAGGQGFQLRALTAAVPEPAAWAMMIAGFGVVGAASRRRNRAAVIA
jgi:hypothetical protein